jgi:D-alanine--poly(phosphoribitol) ligase subunit 2
MISHNIPEQAGGGVMRQVRELLTRVLRVQLTSDDTDVIEAGMLDSLAVVELLVAIEEEFAVQVDLEHLDLDDLRTPRSIASLVEHALADAGKGSGPAAA